MELIIKCNEEGTKIQLNGEDITADVCGLNFSMVAPNDPQIDLQVLPYRKDKKDERRISEDTGEGSS